MSERWWRAYDGAVHDPKLQTLPPDVFKLWFNLLCIASKNDGVIPPEDQLKSVLSLRYDRIKRGLTTLLSRGLIDRIEGRLEPHNWRKRQYKSDTSAERMKRYRQRKSDVTVTAPDTDTESEIELTSLFSSQKDRKIVSILGEAKREKPPRHCAQTSKGGGRVYIVKGTPEWESYAADYRAARGEEPTANANGGRWFKKLGENEAWRRR